MNEDGKCGPDVRCLGGMMQAIDRAEFEEQLRRRLGGDLGVPCSMHDGKFVGSRTEDQRTAICHLNGVSWLEATIPRRWHRCTPQTVGYLNYLWYYERCACGAINRDKAGWDRKNERRNNK